MLTRLVATLLAALLSLPASGATLTTNIYQDGNDVVMVMSGSIDLTGLTYNGTTNGVPHHLNPRDAYVSTLLGSGPLDTYQFGMFFGTQINQPVQGLGGTANSTAASTSGDAMFLFLNIGSVGYLGVPQGYASGTQLSGTATFANTDLATLGLNLGSYQGLVNNTVFDVLVRDAAPVPLPGAMALFLAGLGGLGVMRQGMPRRR